MLSFNFGNPRETINREFVHPSKIMRCNTIHAVSKELACENVTENMILCKNLEYCSNHAKSIKTIADADEKDKIVVKPIFGCPVKKCDAKLTFKLFWTNSCCSAAIRKHSMGEVDALLKPAVEKLKKAEEELARIDKLRNEALKRKNEEKAEVDALEKWKVRIIEKTVGARHLCCKSSCKKEFGLTYKSNKDIECMLRCGHSLCLECVERGIKDEVNVCPVEKCTRTFTKNTYTRVTSRRVSID